MSFGHEIKIDYFARTGRGMSPSRKPFQPAYAHPRELTQAGRAGAEAGARAVPAAGAGRIPRAGGGGVRGAFWEGEICWVRIFNGEMHGSWWI